MRKPTLAAEWKTTPLAEKPTLVFQMLAECRASVGRPSIEAMSNGRLLAAFDQIGPDVKNFSGKKGHSLRFNHWLQSRLFTSTDHGQTWSPVTTFPFGRARLFRSSADLYLLGDDNTLMIARSCDGGLSWSEAASLTAKEPDGDTYAMTATNTMVADGQVYAAGMRIGDFQHRGAFGPVHRLFAMRAPVGANLLNRKSWTFSEASPPLREWLPLAELKGWGLPLHPPPPARKGHAAAETNAAVFGWYDPNMVELQGASHVWRQAHAPTHIALCAADIQQANLAIPACLQANEAGTLSWRHVAAPSGAPWHLAPVPGGHAKFSIFWDAPSQLYWLASNRCINSSGRAPAGGGFHGFALNSLQLHFSRDLLDWSFAGLIEQGTNAMDVRMEPAAVVDGKDLCIVCRAGRPDAHSARETPFINFYRIPDFRELIY